MASERRAWLGRGAASAWLVASVGACTAILGDGYEVVPDGGPSRDSGSDSTTGRDTGRRDAPTSDASTSHDGGLDATDARGSKDARADIEGVTKDAGVDRCAPLTSLLTKAECESNLCSGVTCTPGSNHELDGSTLCADEGGVLSCPLPAYVPQKDAATDVAPPSADSGTTYPRCSALPQLTGGYTYPSTYLYAIGSTAIQPYVAHIAQLFAAGVASTTDGGARTAITVIYAGAGSCVGVQAAYAAAGASPPPINTLATTANYYDPSLDPDGNPIAYTCELDSTAPADLGVSDVFPSSCSGLGAPIDPLPAPYYDFFGPVQVMEMLVPTSSPATTITYEETGLVWAYGGKANIAPWTDSSFLFRRSASSGTQTMISLAAGLDPRVWVGVSEATSGAVKTALVNVDMTGEPDGGTAATPQANAAKTIGILASDSADGIRQSARPLAFQDRGQSCAWLPDSSLTTFDKVNVRDGHYPIWGPSHFITTVSSSFLPNPTVAKLIDAVNGTDPDVAQVLDVVRLYATSHLVPTCAMHVSRSSDGQSYGFYQPPGKSSCSCYYDDQVPNDTTSCTPCTTDTDCASAPGGATSCNIFGLPPKGFCEVPGS